MCGRFSLFAEEKDLEERFKFNLDFPLTDSYNIAPTQNVLVLIEENGIRLPQMFRWGLIPFWAKDKKIGSKMINARAETINEKPSFKRLLSRKRCLIPASGFFEWAQAEDKKQPYFIRIKDEVAFSFAGLWDTWDKEGTVLHTCTIITTNANELMKPIHNRMPIILDPDKEAAWLDLSLNDPDYLKELLTPYPSDLMEAYPVSNVVGSPRNNSNQNIRPLNSL